MIDRYLCEQIHRKIIDLTESKKNLDPDGVPPAAILLHQVRDNKVTASAMLVLPIGGRAEKAIIHYLINNAPFKTIGELMRHIAPDSPPKLPPHMENAIADVAAVAIEAWQVVVEGESNEPMPENCSDDPRRETVFLFGLNTDGVGAFAFHKVGRRDDGTVEILPAELRWSDEMAPDEFVAGLLMPDGKNPDLVKAN